MSGFMSTKLTARLAVLCTVTAASLCVSGLAIAKPPTFVPTYQKTKHLSGEVVPKHEVNMTFSVPHCAIDSTLPSVKEYESVTSLESVDTRKLTPVRVVHLYLFEKHVDQKCQVTGVNGTVEIRHRIAPVNGRMTHYLITMSEGVSVVNLENKASSK